MLVKITDRIWVDPRKVIALLGSAEGTSIYMGVSRQDHYFAADMAPEDVAAILNGPVPDPYRGTI